MGLATAAKRLIVVREEDHEPLGWDINGNVVPV
jgi:hypothetical protein